MLQVDHHAARQYLRMRQGLADRIHRPHRHAGGVEHLDPVRAIVPCQHRLHRRDQFGQVAHPVGIGGEARIGLPLRVPQHIGDALPVRLVGTADVDVAVGGAERLVRRGEHMARTQRLRRHPGGEEDRRVPVGLLQRGFHQRGVDHLPAPGLQLVHVRGEDAHRGEDAAVDVCHRVAGLHRRTAGLAGDAHQAREALRDQVEAALVGPRPVATVPGHRAVDQAGIDLRQHVVAETELLERAAPVVLGEHVGACDHPAQHLLALLVLEVQRDAALVAVQDHERCRHAVHARLAIAARVVATGQLLDLDHFGAEVGEHHAGGGPGHDLSELEHAHAGERTGVRTGMRRGVRVRARNRGGAHFSAPRTPASPWRGTPNSRSGSPRCRSSRSTRRTRPR